MEISHASTETQSAAVGIKGQAKEVTVSTNAEFMMMIAHGIYSNKPLALVRELLCNARDGHAKAGCLDKPILVTLEDNKLVVRDHGTGIPNEVFTEIYLTFGESTKRKSQDETGGFGVGSKVPWAVCDTFSARNWINGTMTAYSITKSDPKLKGKPSCVPIMTVPSKEPSGVEVSVPFPEKMHRDIHAMITLFALELDIPIIFNGTLTKPTGAFGGAELKKRGFFRAPSHPRTVIQPSEFYVRQGDVLYPVECQEEFKDAWDMLLLLAPSGRNPLILQAKPDSIIPTLSRESLQYTERTTLSIRELMKNVLQDLANNVDAYAEGVKTLLPVSFSEPDFVDAYWNNNYELAAALHPIHHQVMDKKLSDTQNDMLFTNMKRWLQGKTPYLETKAITGKEFREDLLKQAETRFKAELVKFKEFDTKRLIQIWDDKFKRKDRYIARDPKLHKALIRHAYEEVMLFRAEMRANNNIVEVYYPRTDSFTLSYHTPSSMFVHTTMISEDLDKRKEEYFERNEFILDTLYLSNTVVISNQPAIMLQRAREHLPEYKGNVYMRKKLGVLAGARCLRIRAQTKPDEIEAMQKHFEGMGYKVIVLLKETRDEALEKARLAEERAKLREIPLPTLNKLIYDNIPVYPEKTRVAQRRKLRGLMKNTEFKGKPLYLLLNRGKELPMNINSVAQFYKLARFVGTDIMCVSTKPELAKVMKEGRTNVDDALLEFAQWFFRRRDIYEKLFWRNTMFARRAKQNRILTRYLFNVDVPFLTPQEELFYNSLIEFSKFCPKLDDYVRGRIKFFEQACTAEAHYERVFEKYADVNFCDVYRALEKAYSEKPSHKRTVARAILKTILKERPA
jgi:hypothetical protein